MTTNPRLLMEEFGLQPKKSLGQNFLHDPNALEKIVVTAELMPEETVIEIGPGTGALTAHLAQVARHVVAIEVDERLRPVLEAELAQYANVYLVFEDALKVDLLQLVGTRGYVVVANLPYYITSALLRHVLEVHRRPRRVVVTVQRELAERIIAKPGNMSLLAVSVQYYGKPRIVTRLKPAAFWPRPDVESAVLSIETYDKSPVDVPDDATFFRVVRAGFSLKRKQLKNALSSGLGITTAQAATIIEAADIDPRRRAETLSLEEWGALSRQVASAGV
ncbi:MAG: ribosomal RNA small subunit methyltransferase A [Chloroflexi bacterium]|nr:MAG: ribosomal RNA small subunit methyltransferase A [Chloroflexota bacterium]